MKNSVVVDVKVSLDLSDVVRIAGADAAGKLLDQVIASAKKVNVTVTGVPPAKPVKRTGSK